MSTAIQETEREIMALVQKLHGLRKEEKPAPVEKNYVFQTITGPLTLRELFGSKDTLLVIHNMGQGCRYCTLWGDGLSPLVTHLEDRMSVVMVSKDAPDVQRTFANARQWRFRMASHGGGDYIREQTVADGQGNMPGVVCYVREGEKIFRKNASVFGPYDLYSPQWHLLSLAGVGDGDWTPQFNYWKRPEKLDDGGENVR